jgi:hypothetical protein
MFKLDWGKMIWVIIGYKLQRKKRRNCGFTPRSGQKKYPTVYKAHRASYLNDTGRSDCSLLLNGHLHIVLWLIKSSDRRTLTQHVDLTCRRKNLALSNPIFLPPAYYPALIYFGRKNGWWITCNYPTVLKEKNINRNRKSKTCTMCWLKSVLNENKRREQVNYNVLLRPTLWFSCCRRFSSCSTDFSQQIAQVVPFLFMFSLLKL